MVLLLHFSITYDCWDNGPLPALVGRDWAWSMLGYGNYGVTVFFVISGFLITRKAIGRYGALRAIDMRDFYIRRFARIAPLLVLAVLIIVGLGLLRIPSFLPDGPHQMRNLLLGAVSVLGFFHNILMQRLGYFDYALNVYWSLSVEEVFYLLFPLVCIALRRNALIVAACLILIAIGPFYRAAHPHNDIYYLYANLACFDAIAVGCLTALLARSWQPKPAAAGVFRAAGTIALLIVWLRGFDGSNRILSFTAISFATGSIILGGLHNASGRLTTSPPARFLRWLGGQSYELYLFHIIVFGVMRDLIPGPRLSPYWQLPWLLVFLALSVMAAAMAANYAGNPANRWLRRTARSRRN